MDITLTRAWVRRQVNTLYISYLLLLNFTGIFYTGKETTTYHRSFYTLYIRSIPFTLTLTFTLTYALTFTLTYALTFTLTLTLTCKFTFTPYSYLYLYLSLPLPLPLHSAIHFYTTLTITLTLTFIPLPSALPFTLTPLPLPPVFQILDWVPLCLVTRATCRQTQISPIHHRLRSYLFIYFTNKSVLSGLFRVRIVIVTI